MSTWYITPFRISDLAVYFFTTKDGHLFGEATRMDFRGVLSEVMPHSAVAFRIDWRLRQCDIGSSAGGRIKRSIFRLFWKSRWRFSNTMFHPYLAKWSNLTNILQICWNHHLEMIWIGRTEKNRWIQGGSWWTCIASKVTWFHKVFMLAVQDFQIFKGVTCLQVKPGRIDRTTPWFGKGEAKDLPWKTKLHMTASMRFF